MHDLGEERAAADSGDGGDGVGRKHADLDMWHLDQRLLSAKVFPSHQRSCYFGACAVRVFRWGAECKKFRAAAPQRGHQEELECNPQPSGRGLSYAAVHVEDESIFP